MILIHFNIRNPYSRLFKNIKVLAGKTPFKHKFWEFEIYKSPDLLIFGFDLTHKKSHAGLELELGLLTYCIRFNFYDNRHWENDKWTR